ncbi:hypothetical protein D187_004031 [Cystobacter fuscus DSM 2262]|uniref:Uncharacterized protein n=1 Tax=Cystobacter fuscus (strain ATCC 25194 / DSM 2262 / NBRC 100088 / M29) TaxID=1242864 RepID=S9P1D5_CYSF2|nr:hypothetical protein [Cystobacter fuscus]EPX58275.1 hypothetical protein D187_004031 [Cystobacter fuscus DSM 2262]
MNESTQKDALNQDQLAEEKQLTLEELEQVVGGDSGFKVIGHKDPDSETKLIEF